MSVQQTLIIVKPDGIAKGLVGQILRTLKEHDLQVIENTRTQVSREWAESLYGNEREEVYFADVVNWVSSAPVLFLKIEGENAVDKVKWDIIGRYPNGIRGQYSENWIKNVAHSPDSIEAATCELKLSEGVFAKGKSYVENRFTKKTVFALTGMSECGKSTVGEYFNSIGVDRLKIVNIFGKLHAKRAPHQEFYEFLSEAEQRDPFELWDFFLDELLGDMLARQTNAVSIESLYGGGLGPYLKQKLGEHFHILYVDISLEIRIQRQMMRENLTDAEEAKKILLPRDEIKARSGIPELKEISDEVIDNSVPLKNLYRAIDLLAEKYLV